MAILLPTDYVFGNMDGPVWVTSYGSYLDVREKRKYILKDNTSCNDETRKLVAEINPIRFSAMEYFIEFAVKDNMKKINEQLGDISRLEREVLLKTSSSSSSSSS